MNGGDELYATPISLTEGRIDRLIGEAIHDEIIWALRPKLTLALAAASRSPGDPLRRAIRDLVAAARRGMPARRRAVPSVAKGPAVDTTGGILRIWGSENQRLAVGARRSVSLPLPPPVDATIDGQSVPGLREVRAAFPQQVGAIDDLLGRSVVMRSRIRALLDEARPTTVVVGSTEHLYTRLLVGEARRRGIPSVYVPHAPAATNRIYGDLPVDHCLLGHRGDAAHYLGAGADGAGIHVIGDPVGDGVSPMSSTKRLLLFATTATADRPPDDLRAALHDVVAQLRGTGLPVLVAPHPRDRVTATRVASELGLKVYEGRTEHAFAEYEVVAMVTERASGSALYAARLGVPTLRWAGPPNYVFEERLEIGCMATEPDLFPAILDGATVPIGGSAVAAEWDGVMGLEAAAARESFLANRPGLRAPTLDSWGHWVDHGRV